MWGDVWLFLSLGVRTKYVMSNFLINYHICTSMACPCAQYACNVHISLIDNLMYAAARYKFWLCVFFHQRTWTPQWPRTGVWLYRGLFASKKNRSKVLTNVAYACRYLAGQTSEYILTYRCGCKWNVLCMLKYENLDDQYRKRGKKGFMLVTD